MRAKMNTKKILVSLCTIAMALFLVATVSAVCSTPCNTTSDVDCTCCGAPATSPADSPIAGCVTIEVDGVSVNNNPSLTAGETVTIKVSFTPIASASDVVVEAELDNEDYTTNEFVVEAGHTVTKSFTMKVPSEIKDHLSDDITLDIVIKSDDKNLESEYKDILLTVLRPLDNAVVKSIVVPQSVDAGETIPVDILLKNLGYNDLDDVYVTVGVPALGVENTAYFGDLVAQETDSCTDNCDDEETDSVSGRIYLEIPFSSKAGIYTLEVRIVADDKVVGNFARQIAVENNLPENVIVTSTSKTVAVGQDAEYTLLIVNPTNSLMVYKVVAESSGEISSSVDSAVVAVPAGSSKTVTVTAKARLEGDYNFDVNVFSNEKLVDKVTLNLRAEGKAVNPIVVLTIVLAIIFLVLLVVLIVLIGRKPQKSEEYGESYY
jgi:hypothetical protein